MFLIVRWLEADLLNFAPNGLSEVEGAAVELDAREDLSGRIPCPGFEVRCYSFDGWTLGEKFRERYEDGTVVRSFLSRHHHEQEGNLFDVAIRFQEGLNAEQLREWSPLTNLNVPSMYQFFARAKSVNCCLVANMRWRRSPTETSAIQNSSGAKFVFNSKSSVSGCLGRVV